MPSQIKSDGLPAIASWYCTRRRLILMLARPSSSSALNRLVSVSWLVCRMVAISSSVQAMAARARTWVGSMALSGAPRFRGGVRLACCFFFRPICA